MKKIAMWLNEHAICLGDSIEANVLHLWCILVSAVVVTFFAAMGWRGKAMEILLAVLLLGGSILPPIIEAIRALMTKTKWEPWYWFPIVIGNSLGTLLSMAVCYILGWHG